MDTQRSLKRLPVEIMSQVYSHLSNQELLRVMISDYFLSLVPLSKAESKLRRLGVYGSTVSDFYSHRHVNCTSVTACQYFVSKCRNPTQAYGLLHCKKDNLLREAVKRYAYDVVKYVLTFDRRSGQVGRAKVSLYNTLLITSTSTPLDNAVDNSTDRIRTIEVLLDFGASITHGSCKVLHDAVYFNDTPLVYYILNRYPKLDVTVDSNKILREAARIGNTGLIEALYTHSPHINANDGNIPAICMAISYNHLEVVELMLKLNVEPVSNLWLHEAASWGRLNILRVLVEYDAKTFEPVDMLQYDTALTIAVIRSHVEVVHYLLSLPLEYDLDDALLTCVDHIDVHIEVLDALLCHGANIRQDSLLVRAGECYNVNMIYFLVSRRHSMGDPSGALLLTAIKNMDNMYVGPEYIASCVRKLLSLFPVELHIIALNRESSNEDILSYVRQIREG